MLTLILLIHFTVCWYTINCLRILHCSNQFLFDSVLWSHIYAYNWNEKSLTLNIRFVVISRLSKMCVLWQNSWNEDNRFLLKSSLIIRCDIVLLIMLVIEELWQMICLWCRVKTFACCVQHKLYKTVRNVPLVLKDVLDEETFEKARLYQLDRSKFGFWSGLYSQLILTVSSL